MKLKRYVVVGGEPELALLLHIFPEGVEELDGAYAVYADEPPLGFDVVEVDDVAEGWEDTWRAFHHGVRVGRCWVGPPWEEPPADAVAVVIDPGRAFGTGAHATTRLCLELLQETEPVSLLDVGCGSGVLAVAAAKLGFAPVLAFDVDDVALETTRSNAAANGAVVDVVAGLRPARLAVMNISLDVVERMLPELPVERAITSGYLERDEPRVEGWQQVEHRVRDGWAADLFVRTWDNRPVDVVIRPPRPGDGPGLVRAARDLAAQYAELEPERFAVPDRAAQLASFDEELAGPRRDDALWLVAEVEGEAVGEAYAELLEPLPSAAVQPQRDVGRRRVHLDYLAVQARLRSRGIGGRLLEAVEAWARERGAELITTDTNLRSNVGAVEFYERHGYERQAVVLRKPLT